MAKKKKKDNNSNSSDGDRNLSSKYIINDEKVILNWNCEGCKLDKDIEQTLSDLLIQGNAVCPKCDQEMQLLFVGYETKDLIHKNEIEDYDSGNGE